MTGTIAPIGVGTATPYTRTNAAGVPVVNQFVGPGNTNAPIVFEPPPGLSGGQLELWIVATGGADWGGCQVYVSTDGDTYALAGSIAAGARQGVLTASLPGSADPDTTDTLSVDLTESLGQLLSGTQADADTYVTLCYCDGELVSYETATLTAAHKYTLTYLRRGAYGTPIGGHTAGAQFARLGPSDPAILKYVFPASYVGRPIFIKLPAFNTFGQQLQSLASVSAISYTLTGAGAVLPNFPVAGSQTGPTTGNLVVGRFAFCSTVIFGHQLGGSEAVAATAATAATTYQIEKNGTAVGTLNFAAGAATATFTSVSVSTAFDAGDVLTVVAPATPDATLAGIAWTLAGHQGAPAPVAEMHGSQTGPTTGGLVIGRWTPGNPVAFQAGLSGSVGTAGTAATAAATYSLQKNGVPFGTMSFAAGATTATFAATSATVFNPGDVLTAAAPAAPDATLANLAWAFAASNNLTRPTSDVEGSVSGPLTGNLVVQRYVFAESMVVPAGMTGSVGVAGSAGVAATAFAIAKNGIAVGTMNFAGGATAATFAMTNPTAFNPGDVLTVTAPASPDASLGDLCWAVAGQT